MTFWTSVAIGYLMLLGAGLAIGRYVAMRRFRGGGRGRGRPVAPTPTSPPSPTFALACPPLGSAFDRALLPDAFPDHELARV